MKKTHQPISKLTVVIHVIMACLIIGLGFVVAGLLLQPKGRVSCADFGSYADIQAAYIHGDTWLSRPGKDGEDNHVPCESMLSKEVATES